MGVLPCLPLKRLSGVKICSWQGYASRRSSPASCSRSSSPFTLTRTDAQDAEGHHIEAGVLQSVEDGSLWLNLRLRGEPWPEPQAIIFDQLTDRARYHTPVGPRLADAVCEVPG